MEESGTEIKMNRAVSAAAEELQVKMHNADLLFEDSSTC